MQVSRQIFRLTTRANHDLTQLFMTWCSSSFILMERTGRYLNSEGGVKLAVIEGYRTLPLVNLVVTLQAIHTFWHPHHGHPHSGVAPGEGYSPLSKHASPPSECEKLFCRRFLVFRIPRKPYFSPLVGRVSPLSENSWRHPCLRFA